jgi:hypothetical protein
MDKLLTSIIFSPVLLISSDPDPFLIGFWIMICIVNPDPEGGKSV